LNRINAYLVNNCGYPKCEHHHRTDSFEPENLSESGQIEEFRNKVGATGFELFMFPLISDRSGIQRVGPPDRRSFANAVDQTEVA
jgi:hypothetical protein